MQMELFKLVMSRLKQQINFRIQAVKSMRAAVQIWTLRVQLKKPDPLLYFVSCLAQCQSEHWPKTETIEVKFTLSTVIQLLHREGYKHCDVASTNVCQPVSLENSPNNQAKDNRISKESRQQQLKTRSCIYTNSAGVRK